MNEEKRAALTAKVAEDLAGHEYTLLVDQNGVEAWRCKAPGSIYYAFDICVTRFGMSVMGDIGSLGFHVGASYGINFLRHQSDRYLHEKLDGDCKKEVIDFDAIRDTVCGCIAGRIESAVGADEYQTWMDDIQNNGATPEQAEGLVEWMKLYAEDERLPFTELIDVIEGVETFADGRDHATVLAYDWLTGHEELIGGSDLWESRIEMPCPLLMQRLYYVRHAANAIMAIKEAAAAEAEKAKP